MEICDIKSRQKKKSRQKLPKNGFTRKLIYFYTFTKIAKNVGDLAKLIAAKGFKKLPKVQ